jgi:hemolysin III
MINKNKAELANSLTHGFSLLFFSILSVLLLFRASQYESTILLFSLIVFVASLILLYTFSTLYHATKKEKAKQVLRKCDHIGIYLLIAGSYTPLLLVAVKGSLGWIFFFILWGLAVFGIFYKVFFLGKLPLVSLLLYLAMGWSVIFIIKPVWNALSISVLICILFEGIFYTVGTYFFWKDNKHTYYHAIWHVFVLLGTLSHFFAVRLLLE